MIYRRKDADGKERPHWFFRFKRNGVVYRVNTKLTNKRDAQDAENLKKAQLAKGEMGLRDPTKIPTLKKFNERFSTSIKARSEKKYQFYKSKMVSLLAFAPLANARLNQIDGALIEDFIQHRLKQGVVPATVNRGLATLRRCLNVAVEWNVIASTPKVKLLPGERERTFVLSYDKEAEYLAACPPLLRDVATLLLETGLRVGEARNLEWSDIHFEPVGKAKYGHLKVRSGKTLNAVRTVSLSPRAVAVLKAQPRMATDDFVFSTGTGKPYKDTHLSHLQAKVREELGWDKDFVLHSTRHTFLTRMAEDGASAFMIKKLAGHSTIAVSQKYVHPSDEAMERAFDKKHEAAKARSGPKVAPEQKKKAG